MPQGKENKMMHNNIAETKLCQKRSFEVPTYITKPSNKWRESQSHWKEEKSGCISLSHALVRVISLW